MLGANSITYLADLVIWLIQIWIFTNARHTVQRKADNLDSSDTWSGKNAQVVDNGSFETGNYLKQQLRIRFVPFLYRRGPSEDISCFDKNRSIKKVKTSGRPKCKLFATVSA